MSTERSDKLHSAQLRLDWEATVDAILDPIAVADADGRILRANRAFFLRFGAGNGHQDVIGQLDSDLLFGPSDDGVPRSTGRTGPRSYETSALAVPGTFLVSHYPIQLEQGPAVVYHLTDLSARKAAEEAAARAETQLRQAQKMEAVGRLAGGVSHDFSNLLTAILMNSEELMATLEEGSREHTAASQIRLAAERGAALTSRLLGFSRAQPLNLEVLDLNVALGSLVRLLRPLLGENIELELVEGAGLRPVHMDRSQIEQIVMNLAINARDAMPAGGQLRIATRNTATAGVELSVADSGVGMDADTCSRATESFFTTKPEGKGTGLGLATVAAIVRENGGSLEIESQPGQGTTVRVCVPAIAAEVPQKIPRSAVPAPSEPRGRETLLLVEDDPCVRGVVHLLLERLGYKVLEADSATTALDIARGHQGSIDLLLTDLVMPGLNGRELTAALREIRPGIRVLLMSGYAPDAERYREAVAGPLPFLRKPFASAVLAKTLRDVLDSRET